MQHEILKTKSVVPRHLDAATYEAFQAEVLYGLSQPQKSLPCKWFYDETGAILFEEITQTPEYYLTRTETRLLRELSPQLARYIPDLETVIEPGSGSSLKTRILLQALPQLKRYIPIDISEEMLLEAARQLGEDFPALEIRPYVYDFGAPVPPMLKLGANQARMVFFPGSTIGNFAPKEAQGLLRGFDALVHRDGWLLLGVDATQDKARLLAAYNDQDGITAQFNKNILARANRELNANFQVERFEHRAIFNRAESRVEMHLVSTQAQTVEIGGHLFVFEPGETIHTENCYKYSMENIEQMAQNSGWKRVQAWADDTGTEFNEILLKSV
jgi:dimethylhistidine N-methyltransferase